MLEGGGVYSSWFSWQVRLLTTIDYVSFTGGEGDVSYS